YPDGVWFVDLAGVSDPQLVGVTVAATLGLRPEPGRPITQTIADHAAGRRMLLLLDTCDAYLLAAAHLVARLLGGGPEARVLATSREPLGTPGEVVWRGAPPAGGARGGGGAGGAGGGAGRPAPAPPGGGGGAARPATRA